MQYFDTANQETDTFPPIGSLGAIGDGHSLALVASDGNIEWFCPARFDAPPLIWPLLDRSRGGCLRVGPAESVQKAMRYVDESAVLACSWRTDSGVAQARLCMEWPPCDGQQRLLWVVRGISGSVDVDIEFTPSFDFGRIPIRSHYSRSVRTFEFEAGNRQFCLQASCALETREQRATGRVCVEAGDEVSFCLSTGLVEERSPLAISLSSVPSRVEAARAAWCRWSADVDWIGRYREHIVRSAITLKLLIYEPTGAVVAAGTTSLPEKIGGVRNWDYRYTWFRDAGMTLSALFSLGCRREAHRWAEWMQETILQHGTPLRVLYSVDGRSPEPESELVNVTGYRGSGPVRVGNAADSQFQLDVYGELLECVFICDTMADDALHSHWPHMREAADYIAAHWREPDNGIWEVRGEPRHFVHSKVTAWEGLQRACWLQSRHGLGGNMERWRREAQALREDILRHGVTSDSERFVRSYGEDGVDASLLLLSRSGFINGTSNLFKNTVDAVCTQLRAAGSIEGLLQRYVTNGGDGLPEGEGAFTICSFWLVQALVASGNRDGAEALFERLLGLRGDLGLYAEQVEPATGLHLGNFPQAFTHIGLVNAARSLQERGERGSSGRY